MLSLLKDSGRHASTPHRAFTLTELMVVLGLLVILATLPVSVSARAREKSKRVQCLSNLKQFGLSMLVYANDFGGRFPTMGAGYWPWDLPNTVADQLMVRGAQRHIMYDPGFPEQDNDTLWNWGNCHMTGYAMTFPGTAGVAVTNLNYSLIPKPITSGGITYRAPLPSERPLLACATLSIGENTTNRVANQYTGIYGGWGPHRAPHLEGKIPSGGNVGMLDGSVRWVVFASMIPRTTPGFSPTFWW